MGASGCSAPLLRLFDYITVTHGTPPLQQELAKAISMPLRQASFQVKLFRVRMQKVQCARALHGKNPMIIYRINIKHVNWLWGGQLFKHLEIPNLLKLGGG